MSRRSRARRPESCSASNCASSRRKRAGKSWLLEETSVPKTPIRELPHAPVVNTVLNPAGWPQPKGYANGIKARGEMVFTGGMVGWDEQGKFAKGFVAQTRQAL